MTVPLTYVLSLFKTVLCYFVLLCRLIKLSIKMKILLRKKHAFTEVLSFFKKIHLERKVWNSCKIKECKKVTMN